MKIHELIIQNIRGITTLKFEPKGKNFLISGPNGTGKSSVIDAIDFLLTGDITRFTGRGTQGITIKKYGSHLDNAKLEEAFVSAVVSLNEKDLFKITRTIGSPDQLNLSDEKYRIQLEKPLLLAKEGQHILTRREILNYIATEPSERSKRIQSLLNLNRVEEMRQAFVKLNRQFKQQFTREEGAFRTENAQVAAIVQNPNFDGNVLLNFINIQRQILGSLPLATLDIKNIRADVKYDDSWGIGSGRIPTLQIELSNLKTFEEKYGSKLQELDTELRQILILVTTDNRLKHALEQYELTELGIGLLDDSGQCPLCEIQWDPLELRSKLENKLELGEEAKYYNNQIENIKNQIKNLVDYLLASLKRVVAIANQIKHSDKTKLYEWQQEVERFKLDLEGQHIEYLKYPSSRIIRGFIDFSIQDLLASFEKAVVSDFVPPEQVAYDNLVKLEQAIQNWQQANGKYQEAKKSYAIAQNLHDEFIASRDNVLNALYDKIRDRFEDIYRKLHFEDENNFSAELNPSDTGLTLDVDFHGRGKHSPLALHSEGHQDSMGLCLFLALAENIAQDKLNLIVLDDVVMSVDAGHRKSLCKVLADTFKGFQIIIATHDKTWHHQLIVETVVTKNEIIEFLSWHIATGPRTTTKVDVWEKIVEDLDKNDVPSAAHKLRRWAEMYFADVCERLGAKVIFRQDSRWELGDLLDPAISTLKGLNKKAKNAANTWKHEDKKKELEIQGDSFDKLAERIKNEKWPINPLIHYNDWINISKSEFADVYTVFRDLTLFFECPHCNGMLSIDRKIDPTSVRCHCSNVNWNLQVKSNS